MSAIELAAESTKVGGVSRGPRAAKEGFPSLVLGPRPLISCLDWFERLLVLAFYVWLVVGIVGNYWAEGGLANLLLLPSEGLVVVLLLLRRPAQSISTNPGEWLLALGGTCAAMLVRAEPAQAVVSPLIGGAVVLMGILVQLSAKIALGFSLGCVPAHRGLKLKGPYRFVRHPMYAGYSLSHTGFLLMNATLWNLALYAGCEIFQILRLLAEERLLSSDPRYLAYRGEVRYRLIPGLF